MIFRVTVILVRNDGLHVIFLTVLMEAIRFILKSHG